MDISERIKSLIRVVGMNPHSFAKKMNMRSTIIDNIIKGKTKSLEYATLRKIIETYNVNAAWLFPPYKGRMFLDNTEEDSYINDDSVAYQIHLLKEKDLLIKALQKTIESQDQLIKQNTAQQELKKSFIENLEHFIDSMKEGK